MAGDDCEGLPPPNCDCRLHAAGACATDADDGAGLGGVAAASGGSLPPALRAVSIRCIVATNCGPVRWPADPATMSQMSRSTDCAHAHMCVFERTRMGTCGRQPQKMQRGSGKGGRGRKGKHGPDRVAVWSPAEIRQGTFRCNHRLQT
eukprot:364280-Chlamydomonas_euryale.AAC.2